MDDDFDRRLKDELERGYALASARPVPGKPRYRSLAGGGWRGALVRRVLSPATAAITAATLLAGGGVATAAAATGGVNPQVWGLRVQTAVTTCRDQLAAADHGIGRCVSAVTSHHLETPIAIKTVTSTPTSTLESAETQASSTVRAGGQASRSPDEVQGTSASAAAAPAREIHGETVSAAAKANQAHGDSVSAAVHSSATNGQSHDTDAASPTRAPQATDGRADARGAAAPGAGVSASHRNPPPNDHATK